MAGPGLLRVMKGQSLCKCQCQVHERARARVLVSGGLQFVMENKCIQQGPLANVLKHVYVWYVCVSLRQSALSVCLVGWLAVCLYVSLLSVCLCVLVLGQGRRFGGGDIRSSLASSA